jgi:hypothetical protein
VLLHTRFYCATNVRIESKKQIRVFRFSALSKEQLFSANDSTFF